MELDTFIHGELCQNWGALCRRRAKVSKKPLPSLFLMLRSSAFNPKIIEADLRICSSAHSKANMLMNADLWEKIWDYGVS